MPRTAMPPSPASSMLEISDLSLRFGGLAAIDGMDLSLSEAEVVALIGPNGAGKTSLVNCITATYQPQGGTIRFAGADISSRHPSEIARLGLARTFQHNELVAEFDVVENLLLARHSFMKGNFLTAGVLWWFSTRHEEDLQRAKVDAILRAFDLESFRGRPAGNLPYGVQKRIGVARALALEPKLLLLDEPASGLRPEEKDDLVRMVLDFHKQQGLAVLWIEHDLRLVRALADRLIVMHYGKKLADGEPDTVLGIPEVVEAYVGTSSARGGPRSSEAPASTKQFAGLPRTESRAS